MKLGVYLVIFSIGLFSSPANALNLNDLRLRIADNLSEMNSKLYDYFRAIFDDGVQNDDKELIDKFSAISKEQRSPVFEGGRVRRSVVEILSEDLDVTFSFSEWGDWTNCSSFECGLEGLQWRYRTCYGTNLQTQQDHPCRYENLVESRKCHPEHCNGTEILNVRWGEWTMWSPCSVSCGRGGMQQRTRPCVTENNTTIPSEKCTGENLEERECQYSSSCPTWDDWTLWSPCSDTCGGEGVSYRKRRCIVYRYFVSGSADEDESTGSDDSGVGAIIYQGHKPIHIVDAVDGVSMENATFFKEETLKREILLEMCLRPSDLSEEQKPCTSQGECASQWSSWGKWSACRRGCEPGFRKRERTCIRNINQESCEGQKILYRRCYPLPCWGSWVATESCSATCGKGLQLRTRKCNLYSTIPPYDKCIGESEELTNCTLEPCEKDGWTPWSPFSQCTVSCNGGFQFRNRTCLRDHCHGDSNDLRLCNRQRCPSWSGWQQYSCCNSTCGPGMRNRTRTCMNGSVGEPGCQGPTTQEHVCYGPPCDGLQKAEFEDMPCGLRPQSSPKIAVLRIFMGKTSTAHGWPWQASWQHRLNSLQPWKHVCGAALIHQRWVVTAGHCIEEAPFYLDKRDPGTYWSVVLGMHELYQDGERLFAEMIIIHPGYSRKLVTFNDIALIKLRTMVEFTEQILPVCLPGNSTPETGELCTVTGWGFTTPGGNHSKYLMEAQLPIVDFKQCRTLGDYYTYFLSEQTHLCAGNPIDARADSCTGDSGGPLSCNGEGDQWYLSAVTSFGFAECGTPGHAGIYVPVKEYDNWIRGIVANNTYDTC